MRPGAARRSPPPVLIVLLLAVSLGFAPRASASDDAAALRREAIELARSRRCEAALPALEAARGRDPGDARLPLLAAECQIRLRRYADALVSLEIARGLDPALANLDLYLGIAHYHTGDFEAAHRDLEAARIANPGSAEIELYLGMLELQAGRLESATVALERARTVNAEAVEPVASYYEGLAHRSLGRSDRAREAFERVVDLAPGSDWADAAARMLATAPGWGPRESWIEATVGTEYDTNVTLAGTEITPGEISGRRDLSTVWSLVGGTEVYRGERFAVGALVSYYGSAFTRLYEYDLEYPGASIWVDRRLDDVTTFRFQSEFNYAWYGYQPYVALGALNPQLFRSFGDYGLTWAYAKFYGGDYFFDTVDLPSGVGPPGIDEAAERNRDGWGLTAGFVHTLPIPAWELDLRAGFNYYHYWSVGSEWRYDGYEPLLLGFSKVLPFGFIVDGQASFIYRTFYHPSTYPENNTLPLEFANVDRRDRVWQFEVKLERPITSWLKASARYYYLDNGSNTAVFNYRKQIWGGYLTLAFRAP